MATKGSAKEPLSRMTSINSTQSKKPALSAEGVLNLYSNCIKLASENKALNEKLAAIDPRGKGKSGAAAAAEGK